MILSFAAAPQPLKPLTFVFDDDLLVVEDGVVLDVVAVLSLQELTVEVGIELSGAGAGGGAGLDEKGRTLLVDEFRGVFSTGVAGDVVLPPKGDTLLPDWGVDVDEEPKGVGTE